LLFDYQQGANVGFSITRSHTAAHVMHHMLIDPTSRGNISSPGSSCRSSAIGALLVIKVHAFYQDLEASFDDVQVYWSTIVNESQRHHKSAHDVFSMNFLWLSLTNTQILKAEVPVGVDEVISNDLFWMKKPRKARNDGIFVHGHR
jgi:tRNA C32,U32 (ribose-2'-O)-methylase TrmJ